MRRSTIAVRIYVCDIRPTISTVSASPQSALGLAHNQPEIPPCPGPKAKIVNKSQGEQRGKHTFLNLGMEWSYAHTRIRVLRTTIVYNAAEKIALKLYRSQPQRSTLRVVEERYESLSDCRSDLSE